ncbi:MAG: hypothetical protein ACI84R_001044 [Candidatus Azotimanducaceae bacterium]|jgi:hypothetical protein
MFMKTPHRMAWKHTILSAILRWSADVTKIIQGFLKDERAVSVKDATIAKVEPARNGLTLIMTDGIGFGSS